MNFGKYNKYTVIDWGVNTENLGYKKLAEYPENSVFKVLGFFTIKDNLNGGNQAIAITKDTLLNLPKHKVEVIEQILTDEDSISAIKNGECYIKTTKYFTKKYNKDCYDFEFIDSADVPEIVKTVSAIF